MDYETPQFYRVIQYAARADRDVVDMVSGSPDWDPPEGIRQGLHDYADADSAQFQYAPSRGLSGLRERIASRHDVSQERVIVTNGAGEANHLAMTCGLKTFPGTEIVLVDPVYPYYAGRANALGAETTFVPVTGDGSPSLSALREATSSDTAVIVVNSPNNPTGAVYDASLMAEIADIADSNNGLLVSDEVYERFDYSGQFSSALDCDRSNIVVTNAFSKSMAITGFRVGYGIFPPEDGPDGDLIDCATTQHMVTTVTGSRPAQQAVLGALKTTSSEYYERCRSRVQERIETFCDAIETVGGRCDRPDGGFYVMATLPGFTGEFKDVYRLIDEAGVAGMPGVAFGSARQGQIRFSMTSPHIQTAVDRLVEYIRQKK
jgi:aspartate/methionine/tyrosine aminotransferase